MPAEPQSCPHPEDIDPQLPPIKNSLARELLFLACMICMYFLPVFIGAICVLTHDGPERMLRSLRNAFSLFKWGFYQLYALAAKPDPYAANVLLDLFVRPITGITLGLLYILPFILWRKRPTILRAFLISLLGCVPGPGIVFFEGPYDGFLWVFIILATLCAFYLALYVGGKAQKKYFPHNELARKIRWFFIKPCPQT